MAAKFTWQRRQRLVTRKEVMGAMIDWGFRRKVKLQRQRGGTQERERENASALNRSAEKRAFIRLGFSRETRMFKRPRRAPLFFCFYGRRMTNTHRVVGVNVEKRRLQDGGGKHDFVHFRVVVGVDGLRQHQPPNLVCGCVRVWVCGWRARVKGDKSN